MIIVFVRGDQGIFAVILLICIFFFKFSFSSIGNPPPPHLDPHMKYTTNSKQMPFSKLYLHTVGNCECFCCFLLHKMTSCVVISFQKKANTQVWYTNNAYLVPMILKNKR